MCGIAGVLSLGNQPVDVSNIKAMCDIIAHRGPDDAGYLVAQSGRMHPKQLQYHESFTEAKFQHITPMLPSIDKPHGQYAIRQHKWDIFFGHRRLSIIDTSSAGHQPMRDLTRSVWLVYNGEIYNYRELKATLQQKGHEFTTETDTEVLIAAYLEWGVDCVQYLNGMFAFALWDKRHNKIFMARDRYGIKPLYYKLTAKGEFIFASEVKSILAYEGIGTTDIDKKALIEYFTFQNIFTDRTFYQDVKLLPAGSTIEIILQGEQPQLDINQYWDFNFEEPVKVKDSREYEEELDRLFNQAVKRQLVSDVEVGSYLSGGMDSGAITAIAASEFPYLKSFTVGFDLNNVSGLELGFDEREKSELMSYRYRTEHYEMVLKSGDMERCLPNFAWHLETPRVGQSYPNYYASKLASKFVKVVLSGAGGDELFGGYPWRYYRAVNNKSFADYIDKYYVFWQRLIDNKHLQKVFAPIWSEVKDVWTRDIFEGVFANFQTKPQTPEDYVNHSLYFEAKTFLHGLLVVEDKLSMAHSLETRVPFLDNDLVDFAMKVPVNLKLGNLQEVTRINENEFGSKSQKYFQKTNDGKLILRKALQKYMPEEITKAVKQGFSSPDQTWFRGESNAFVTKALYNKDSLIYQFFDETEVRQLVGEHMSGKNNRRLFVWGLLNFNSWLQQFNYAEQHNKNMVR